MGGNKFRYILSRDINSAVSYQVDKLEGNLFSEGYNCIENLTPELYVECALYLSGTPFGLPTRTRFEPTGKPKCRDESIKLSAKYRDLTFDAQLAFTVWDVSSVKQDKIIGGATFCLFNKKQLKSGQQKLRLWPGIKADGSVPTTTPGKLPKSERGEIECLEKLVKKYERGQISHINWLDELAFRAIDKIKERESGCSGTSHLHLIFHLITFEHQVAFQDRGAKYLSPSPISPTNELVTVWDPEVGRPNPSETKQVKLSTSLTVTRGVIDRDLKPSSTERKEVLKILKHPPTRTLLRDERQLLWKFRFSLVNEKKALTKFLRCIEWSDAQEARQAVYLMWQWERIDTADALELLSPEFKSEDVRAYAVNVLEQAENEELHCYLLHLCRPSDLSVMRNHGLPFFLSSVLCVILIWLATFVGMSWWRAMILHMHKGSCLHTKIWKTLL